MTPLVGLLITLGVALGMIGIALARGARRGAQSAREWAVATSERLARRIDESSAELEALRREVTSRQTPSPTAPPPLAPSATPPMPPTAGVSPGDLTAVRDELRTTRRALEARIGTLEARLEELAGSIRDGQVDPAPHSTNPSPTGSPLTASDPATAGARMTESGADPLKHLAARLARLMPPAGGAAGTAAGTVAGGAASGAADGNASGGAGGAASGSAADGANGDPKGAGAAGGASGVPAATDREGAKVTTAQELLQSAGRTLSVCAHTLARATPPPAADLSDLLGDVLATFSPGGPGDLGPLDLPSLEDFVRQRSTGRAPRTALELLAFYLEEARPERTCAPREINRAQIVEKAMRWADRLFDLRASAGEDAQPEATDGIEGLVAGVKELLRGFGLHLIAPEPSRPLDASVGRAMGAVPRADLPPNTVIRVLRPGIRDAATGRLVRPAEVVVTSKL